MYYYRNRGSISNSLNQRFLSRTRHVTSMPYILVIQYYISFMWLFTCFYFLIFILIFFTSTSIFNFYFMGLFERILIGSFLIVFPGHLLTLDSKIIAKNVCTVKPLNSARTPKCRPLFGGVRYSEGVHILNSKRVKGKNMH